MSIFLEIAFVIENIAIVGTFLFIMISTYLKRK